MGVPTATLAVLRSRLEAKVLQGGPAECWPWTGRVRSDGYGAFVAWREPVGAHRFALFLESGKWSGPDTRTTTRHTCGNKLCCNPAHLRLDSIADHPVIEGEEWRSIPGIPGYCASSIGRIRGPYRIRKPTAAGIGTYKKLVILLPDGKHHGLWVHRLVASAWIPNPDGKPEVNHKDGDPSNNHPENLEWVTGSENCVHARRVLVRACGSNSGHAKLREDQIPGIRKRLGDRETLESIAKSFGVCQGTIHAIKQGRTWTHVG